MNVYNSFTVPVSAYLPLAILQGCLYFCSAQLSLSNKDNYVYTDHFSKYYIIAVISVIQ